MQDDAAAADFNPQITYTWVSDTLDLGDPSVRVTDATQNLEYIRIAGGAVSDNVERIHVGLTYTVGGCSRCLLQRVLSPLGGGGVWV